MAQARDAGSIQELLGRRQWTNALKANDLSPKDALSFGTGCALPFMGEGDVSAKEGLARKILRQAGPGRCGVFAAILLTMQQACLRTPGWIQG